jgi:hypothetical protein
MDDDCDRCGPTARCTCGDEVRPPAPPAVLDVDQVDHPPHYQGKGLEAIDVIEAFGLGFCLGNTVKYVLRAGKKRDALTDLKKARWYLDRAIAQAEGGP